MRHPQWHQSRVDSFGNGGNTGSIVLKAWLQLGDTIGSWLIRVWCDAAVIVGALQPMSSFVASCITHGKGGRTRVPCYVHYGISRLPQRIPQRCSPHPCCITPSRNFSYTTDTLCRDSVSHVTLTLDHADKIFPGTLKQATEARQELLWGLADADEVNVCLKATGR